jgi:hypothetical protein
MLSQKGDLEPDLKITGGALPDELNDLPSATHRQDNDFCQFSMKTPGQFSRKSAE